MELLRRCAFENGEDLERIVTGKFLCGMGIDGENDKSICSLFNSQELQQRNEAAWSSATMKILVSAVKLLQGTIVGCNLQIVWVAYRIEI